MWSHTKYILDHFRLKEGETIFPKFVMNEIDFDARGRAKEVYDLKGLKIESLSLSWAPYLTLDDCDSQVKLLVPLDIKQDPIS